MLNYIIRKLLSMIPMLLIITFLIYVGVELMPGDVIDFLIPMDQLAEMTPDEVEAFKAAKGLDGPMIVRYFNWLKDVCRGDLGYSLQNNMPVGELMMQKLPATIELSFAALLISTILGIILGVISALHKGGLADNLLTIAGMIGVAIPQFLFGVFIQPQQLGEGNQRLALNEDRQEHHEEDDVEDRAGHLEFRREFRLL